MQNDRLHERQKVQIRGWVTGFGEGLIMCVVEDISAGGAKLIIENDQPLEKFKLYFSPRANTFRNCVVKWRKAGSIGVKFDGAASGVVNKIFI